MRRCHLGLLLNWGWDIWLSFRSGGGSFHRAPLSRRPADDTYLDCAAPSTSMSRSLVQARRILRFTTSAYVPANGGSRVDRLFPPSQGVENATNHSVIPSASHVLRCCTSSCRLNSEGRNRPHRDPSCITRRTGAYVNGQLVHCDWRAQLLLVGEARRKG
jgi:hypothetical protein